LIPKLKFFNIGLEISLALMMVVNAHPQLAILFINKQNQCPVGRLALLNMPSIENVVD
jgi:hypothetical protein